MAPRTQQQVSACAFACWTHWWCCLKRKRPRIATAASLGKLTVGYEAPVASLLARWYVLTRVASLAAAICICIINVGCGDDRASARRSGDAVPSRTAAPERSRDPASASRSDTRAGAGHRGRLPFSFSPPRRFIHGRAAGAIVASLLLDRRNAILISRFGSGAPTGEELQAAIQRKLTEAGSNVRAWLERHAGGPDLVAINLSDFSTSNQVAGRRVAVRRLYFSAGNTIWEVSCQYTREGRKRVLAGCAHIASSLRAR